MINKPDISKIKAGIKVADNSTIDHPSKDPSGRMSTQNIVKNCDELKGSGKDWKKIYAALHHSIASNKYRILRSGNTLFWIQLINPGEAQMYVFNADTNKNFIRNFKDFAKAMEKAKFKKVFGITHEEKLIDLIKRLGYPVDVEDAGVDEKKRKLYKATVNV